MTIRVLETDNEDMREGEGGDEDGDDRGRIRDTLRLIRHYTSSLDWDRRLFAGAQDGGGGGFAEIF